MTTTYIPTSRIANDPACILWLEKGEGQPGKTTLEDIKDALEEYRTNFNAGNVSKAEILTLHRAYPDSPTYKQAAVGIQKMDMVDPLVIGGPASVEMIDREGHLITTQALDKAFQKFMDNQRTRNVMVLHSDVQVGWALPAYISKGGQIFKSGVGDKGLFFICELRDDTAISKKVADQINQGMLKSYSIAGSATKIQNMKKGQTPYMQVDEMELAEVTICEKGVNQGASFELLKAELPQTGKVDKDQCGYRDATAPEMKMGINCGHCKYFNSETRTCDVVVGDIMPGDYCRLFAPCEEKKPQAVVHRKIVIMHKDGTGRINFKNSFLDWMEKEKKDEDPLKSGKSFATLNNFAGREAEHHRLLQEYGFPSEVPLDSMRYVPVVETETDDDGKPINIIPPWVVNEAGQDLGDKLDEDAPSFKKSVDVFAEIIQKANPHRPGRTRTPATKRRFVENVPPKFQPASQSSISDKTQRPIRPNRGNQLTGDARDEAVRSNRATPIGDPTKISVDKANGSTDWMPHVEGIKQGGAETGGVDPQTASKPRFKNFEIAVQPSAEFGRQMGVPQAGDTPPAPPDRSAVERTKEGLSATTKRIGDLFGRGKERAKAGLSGAREFGAGLGDALQGEANVDNQPRGYRSSRTARERGQQIGTGIGTVADVTARNALRAGGAIGTGIQEGTLQTLRGLRGFGTGVMPGEAGRNLRARNVGPTGKDGGPTAARTEDGRILGRLSDRKSLPERLGRKLGDKTREGTGQLVGGIRTGLTPGQKGDKARDEAKTDETALGRLGRYVGSTARRGGSVARRGGRVAGDIVTDPIKQSRRASERRENERSRIEQNKRMMNDEGVGMGVDFQPSAHRGASLQEQHQMATGLTEKINAGADLSPKEWMQAIHHLTTTETGERYAHFGDINMGSEDWNKPIPFSQMKEHIKQMNIQHLAHGDAGKRGFDKLMNKLDNVTSGNDRAGIVLKPRTDEGETPTANWEQDSSRSDRNSDASPEPRNRRSNLERDWSERNRRRRNTEPQPEGYGPDPRELAIMNSYGGPKVTDIFKKAFQINV